MAAHGHRVGREGWDGLGQVGQHLDELAAGAGGIDLARPVGELVERDAALGAVPAQAVDHLRAFLVGDADVVGRAALRLERHADSLPQPGTRPLV